jgi:hypothetical protein
MNRMMRKVSSSWGNLTASYTGSGHARVSLWSMLAVGSRTPALTIFTQPQRQTATSGSDFGPEAQNDRRPSPSCWLVRPTLDLKIQDPVSRLRNKRVETRGLSNVGKVPEPPQAGNSHTIPRPASLGDGLMV